MHQIQMKRVGLLKCEKVKEKSKQLSDFSIEVPLEITKTFDATKSNTTKQDPPSIMNIKIS